MGLPLTGTGSIIVESPVSNLSRGRDSPLRIFAFLPHVFTNKRGALLVRFVNHNCCGALSANLWPLLVTTFCSVAKEPFQLLTTAFALSSQNVWQLTLAFALGLLS